MLYHNVKHRAELKLSRHLSNCATSDHFPDFSQAFFFVKRLKWNFGASEPASNNKRTKQRFVNLLSAVTCVNVTRDENPQRGNEMGSPSFGGFHARLDWSPVSLQAHVQQ